MQYDKDRIKADFDLVLYAKTFIKDLTFKGNSWWGKCPFHRENTASFHIHENGEVWFCQGCGAGGDKVEFVEQIANVDFIEALKIMGGDRYVINPVEKERRSKIEKKEPKIFIGEIANALSMIGGKCEGIYHYSDTLTKARYRLPNEEKVTYRWFTHLEGKTYWGNQGQKHGLFWSEDKDNAQTIYLVEGEKDCLNLAKLGYVVCTASDGADEEAIKFLPEYAEELKDKDVIILNDDNDSNDKGLKYAKSISIKLQGIANSVRIIQPTQIESSDKKGYDISDVIDLIGEEETKKRLYDLINGANSIAEVKVIETNLGNDYDKIIFKCANEIVKNGRISSDSESALNNIRTKIKVTRKTANSDIDDIVQKIRPKFNDFNNSQENLLVIPFYIDGEKIEVAIGDFGYEVHSDNSLWSMETHEQICPQIVVLLGTIEDIENETKKTFIGFNTPDEPERFRTREISNNATLNAYSAQKELSPFGIYITQKQANSFCDYINESRTWWGKRLKQFKSVSHLGWLDNKLLPYERDGLLITGNFDKLKAFEKNIGDKERLKDLIKLVVAEVGIAPIVLGSMIASVLVQPLQQLSFFVNIWGKSRSGKTVVTKVMSAIFGDCDNIWGAADATKNFDSKYSEFVYNLPLVIDDIQKIRQWDVELNKSDIERTIYGLVGGESRGRLNRNGDVREVISWNNVTISMNESKLTSIKSSGGIISRTVEVKFDQVIGRDKGDKWSRIAKENCGGYGKIIADTIKDFGFNNLRARLDQLVEYYANFGLYDKQGVNCALIELGYEIATIIFECEVTFPRELLAKNVKQNGVVDDGERAYNMLIEYIQANIENFRNTKDRFGQIIGNLDYYEDIKVVNVLKHALTELNQKKLFNIQAVLDYGIEKGLIIADKDENGYYKPKQILINGVTTNVLQVVFDWGNKQNNDWRGYDDEKF